MRKKITIVLISLLTALVVMSSGYGKWQKELNIKGKVVVVPTVESLKQLVEDEVNLQKENLEKAANALEADLQADQDKDSFEGTNAQESIEKEKEEDDEDQLEDALDKEDNGDDLENNSNYSSEGITNNQENNTEKSEPILNTDIDNPTTQLEIESSDD